MQTQSPEPQAVPQALPKGRVNILLVDDDEANLLCLQEVLKDLGHELYRARSGQEALKHLLENDFAVILLDIRMPEMDGYETATLVRSRERSRHTPIIFLTATAKNDLAMDKAYTVGAVDYIVKPFVPVVLRAKVSVFVELYEKTRQLQEKSEELARSNAELSQFAYVASHDLQEPLRKIVTFGELLEGRAEKALDEESRDYLARMLKSVGRMEDLIDDLLRLARVTTRTQPLEEVSLGAVAREVVSDLEPRIAKTRGRVELGKLPRLKADPLQMRQLLQNLIGNSLKFHKKDAAPVVKVSGRNLKNGFVELRVEDNGIGFSEKYRDRLFKPFTRLHSRAEYEGTGIGLAICQKIAMRHGGMIAARGEPGKGAVFTVTLPTPYGDANG